MLIAGFFHYDNIYQTKIFSRTPFKRYPQHTTLSFFFSFLILTPAGIEPAIKTFPKAVFNIPAMCVYHFATVSYCRSFPAVINTTVTYPYLIIIYTPVSLLICRVLIETLLKPRATIHGGGLPGQFLILSKTLRDSVQAQSL